MKILNFRKILITVIVFMLLFIGVVVVVRIISNRNQEDENGEKIRNEEESFTNRIIDDIKAIYEFLKFSEVYVFL